MNGEISKGNTMETKIDEVVIKGVTYVPPTVWKCCHTEPPELCSNVVEKLVSLDPFHPQMIAERSTVGWTVYGCHGVYRKFFPNAGLKEQYPHAVWCELPGRE